MNAPFQEPEIVYVRKDELERLRAIESAATAWRRSMECDDWTIHMIEQDATRPGMSALLKLIPAGASVEQPEGRGR